MFEDVPRPSYIKVRAKQLRKSDEGKALCLSHAQALEAVIRNYGFKSYASYLAFLKEGKHEFDIYENSAEYII